MGIRNGGDEVGWVGRDELKLTAIEDDKLIVKAKRIVVNGGISKTVEGERGGSQRCSC